MESRPLQHSTAVFIDNVFSFPFKYNSSDTGLEPKIVRLNPAAVARNFTFTKKNCSNSTTKCCMKVELYGHRSGKFFPGSTNTINCGLYIV